MTLPKRVEHRQPRVRRDLASALRSAAAGLAIPTARAGAAAGRGPRRRPRTGGAARAAAPPPRPRPARPGGAGPRSPSATCASSATTTQTPAEGRRGDQLAGAHVRPDRRAAHRARLHRSDADGDPKVTDDGRLLARIYSESDLLVAECLRSGAWEGLAPAELAAVLSAVLYESRGDAPGAPAGCRDRRPASCAARWPHTRRLSGRAARRRAAAPHRAEPRARRGFRRRRLPLGHHRRPGRGAGGVRHRRATGIAAVGGRLRALVPPGARPARPGAQRRADAGARGPPRNAPSTTFGAASWLLMQGRVLANATVVTSVRTSRRDDERTAGI